MSNGRIGCEVNFIGFKWDNANYICAYDSLLTILSVLRLMRNEEIVSYGVTFLPTQVVYVGKKFGTQLIRG